MIERIVRESPVPQPQQCEADLLSRRKSAQSNMANCSAGDIYSQYSLICVLDVEAYPHAFIDIQGVRLEFRRISRRSDGRHDDARITSLNNLIPLHKRREPSCCSHRPLVIAKGRPW